MPHPILTAWQTLLGDHRHRLSWPDAYIRDLEELRRRALDEGVIDHGQAVEMAELADAAYQAAQEQLATELFHRDSDYIVLDGEIRLGCILRCTYLALPDRPPEVLGRVVHHSDGRLAMYSRTSSFFEGYIDGLLWNRETGCPVRLVEMGRRTAGGGFVPVISEADGYRLALDCRQLAREAHDIEAAKRWALMIEIAAFRDCPACLDRFDNREDCDQCSGLGFIRKAE